MSIWNEPFLDIGQNRQEHQIQDYAEQGRLYSSKNVIAENKRSILFSFRTDQYRVESLEYPIIVLLSVLCFSGHYPVFLLFIYVSARSAIG